MATNEIKLAIRIENKDANASIQLTDDNIKELYKSFKYGKEEVNGLTTAISRGFNNAREIIIGVKEVASLLSQTFAGTFNEFANQEKANIQLATALKQSGIYTKENYKAMLDYASALQQTTAYADDAYITIMAQLSAMGLSAEQTKQAALQTANLASLMETDLSSAARVMGDLFNGNAGMIGRYIKGIDETVIKSKDLSAIIQELNKHIGGQAEAIGNTALGSLAKMKNAFGDLQENIGQILSEGMQPFVSVLSDLLGSLNTLNPKLTGIVGTLGLLTGAAITLRTTGLFPAIFSFKALQIQIASTGSVIRGLYAAIGPGGWILLGIGTLITAVSLLSNTNDGLSESEKEVINNADAEKIKFDHLTETILNQNKSLAERNKAKEEAQKIYPGFLENLSIEKTKYDNLKTAVSIATDEFKKLIEVKILNQRLDLAIQDLAKKQNEEISVGFWDTILGQAQSLINGTPAVINAQVNAATNHAKSVADAQKKVDDLLLQIDEKAKGVSTDKNKVDGANQAELDKLFEKQKSELSETVRHEEVMLSVQSDSDARMLNLKINHFDQMIKLYQKFGKDVTNLVNQRTEAEAKMQKETDADVRGNKETNQKRKFEMQQVEVDEEKHQENLRKSTQITTTEKLALMDEEKQAISIGLGQTAQMFSKQTLAYQAFAKAQALIDTYTAAQSAYKSLVGIPIIGPGLAIAAAVAATLAGLQRVEEIGKVQVPGYALGGRLEEGKAGYVEGWRDEIIAPEQTFVDIMRYELIPKTLAYQSPTNNNAFESLLDKHYERLNQWQENLTFRLERGDLYAAWEQENNFRTRHR